MTPASQVLRVLDERAHAPLYHGTSYYGLMKSYHEDALVILKGVALSFTRDVRMAWEFGSAVLVVDQDKLRQRYRVVPFDYWNQNRNTSPKLVRGKGFRVSPAVGLLDNPYEAEERVYHDIY